MSFTPKNAASSKVDEYQSIRVRQLENQFKFSFDPWLHTFAMVVNDPVKVWGWMQRDNKYRVSWDSSKRVMDFSDDGGRERWALWGLNNVKKYLGVELYNHFGHVKFSINGDLQIEKGEKHEKR